LTCFHPLRPALLLLCSLLLFPAQAADSLKTQRQLFLQAQDHLRQKRLSAFEQSLQALQNYPIQPYLLQDRIRRYWSQHSNRQVLEFIQKHEDFPFADRLRGKLLKRLAKHQQWDDYLQVYDQRNETRALCNAFTARIKTGAIQKLSEDIEPVWLRGTSQPRECDNAFDWLKTHHPDYQTLLWQRIEKALQARRPSLASYLARQLQNPQQQALAQDWIVAHKRPEAALKNLRSRSDTAAQRNLIVHALERLTRRDVDKADNAWEALQKRFSFDQQQIDRLNMKLALARAYQHHPDAYSRIAALPAESKNDNAFLWQARMALRQQSWPELLQTIEQMPARLEQENEWQYWKARAHQKLGHHSEAQAGFSQLADVNTYYGFLAADEVGQDYRIQSQSQADLNNIDSLLEQHPALLRARELFHVDRVVEARREWFSGLRGLSKTEIQQAASLADRWQWHENAIKTAAKGEDFSHYRLRFPTPYRNQVLKLAQKYDLDPALVYGVIRRESAFDPMARSHVGALGLMQLMPATARQMARNLGLEKPGRYAILNIDKNLLLGTHYLNRLMKRYDQNIPLAVAAYNAGPHRVKRWLPDKAEGADDNSLQADIWIESVPFRETRNYVQAVLAYANIFDPKLGQQVRISERMQPVKAVY